MMDALEFLRYKAMLTRDKNDWLFVTDKGVVSLVDLLTEFAALNNSQSIVSHKSFNDMMKAVREGVKDVG